eukprot:3305182-Rhodomonas_salina.3
MAAFQRATSPQLGATLALDMQWLGKGRADLAHRLEVNRSGALMKSRLVLHQVLVHHERCGRLQGQQRAGRMQGASLLQGQDRVSCLRWAVADCNGEGKARRNGALQPCLPDTQAPP